MGNKEAKLVILRMPNFIGDTVMALPAIEILRANNPGMKFCVVCLPLCVDLFRGFDDVTVVVDENKRFKGLARLRYFFSLIRKIRRNNADFAVNFHNTFRDTLILKMACRAPLLGFPKEGSGVLLSYRQRLNKQRHYVNRFAALVNGYLGEPQTVLPPAQLRSQAIELPAFSQSGRPVLGIVFGGKNKGPKHFPHGADALQRVMESVDANYLFLGDPLDAEENARTIERLETLRPECVNDVVDLAGKTSVAEFIDYIAAVDMLVTIDSAAMHIAAAVGTPAVVVTGWGWGACSFALVKPKNATNRYVYGDSSLIDETQQLPQLSAEEVADAVIQHFSIVSK